VFEWKDMFKEGRTSVFQNAQDVPVHTSDNKQEQARAMILKDRRITIRDKPASVKVQLTQ
jgi:hypothetical protein